MPGLDNKISNIIGTAIPTWLLKQLEARSDKNTLSNRDTQNILYLANKSAWIRLVSSINIAPQDISYFQKLGANINNVDDLAKNYVLFGGTSKYKENNNRNAPSYDIRSGIKNDGAYNLLDNTEINDYGYRPMPGITGVSIETQGALGSIRGATINFKVWDKDQLDIMDALYFKLGFSMFLEWGHTYFYHSPRESPNIDPNAIYSTEDYSIDPFTANLKKEEIYSQISKNTRDSEGNYDAMLGVVTNFNFNYNEAGGFDCTLKLMSLGYLGDRIKINHPKTLPNILEAEIKRLNSIYKKIDDAKSAKELSEQAKADEAALQNQLQGKKSLLHYLNFLYNKKDFEPNSAETLGLIDAIGIKNSFQPANVDKTSESTLTNKDSFDFLDNDVLYLQKFGVQIPKDKTESFISTISLDKALISNQFQEAFNKYNELPTAKRTLSDGAPISYVDDYILANKKPLPPLSFKQGFSKFLNGIETGILTYIKDNANIAKNSELYNRMYSIPSYSGNNNDSYNIHIQIRLPQDVKYKNTDDRFKSVLGNILSKESFDFTKFSIETNEDDPRKFYLVLTGESEFPSSRVVKKENVTYEGVTYTDEVVNSSVPSKASFSIIITDTALISNVIANNNNNDALFTDYIKKLKDQDKQQSVESTIENSKVSVSANQVHNAIEYMSSLELMLRTIQIHSLGAAIEKTSDPEIKKQVFSVDLTIEKVDGKPLINQIFSTGIFSPFIQQLIDGTTAESGYPNENRLQVFAKYGFNTALLGNKAELSDLRDKSVDYKQLLKSYVVPYQINQTVTEGTSLNHPVYLQLGTLLMILNHMCTIYDTPNESNNLKDQTPLVYIDFNPETNFCLSTNKHLSTNPFRFLIPFEGTFDDYKSLFNESLLIGNNKEKITHTTDSEESTPLFNPKTDDRLSGQIPQFKYDEKSTSGNTSYKGKIMKVLVNIEYILQMVKQYGQKNETSNVYLKPFLEQIISDLNRSLGNFNLLRLAYNDSANTFHIVDDQLTPGAENEDFISPDNKDEIPLYGKSSIGKNVQIKTDISTKLSNMIAISANSNTGEKSPKSTLSTNSTDFGFINTGYVDRYINNRTEIKEANKKDDKINDTLIKQAITFNQTISDFYSTINPSDSSVDQATNYYIQKMSKIKADDRATRASAMIPVSLNFTTDGIAGMNMGQGFTIPEKFLPYTYNIRKLTELTDVGVNNIQKVGFVVFGLNHNFENNQWNTDVRANMIYLKKIEDFKGSAVQANAENKEFLTNYANFLGVSLGKVDINSLNTNQPWEGIALDFIIEKEESSKFRSIPKLDEDRYRGGYGSDTIVSPTGEVTLVTESTRFTKEDADRTMLYNIKKFAKIVQNQIGLSTWNNLKDTQKAALTSFAYNVGSLTDSVVSAIKSKSGSSQTVANAILTGPTKGKITGIQYPGLVLRRKEEAAIYLK